MIVVMVVIMMMDVMMMVIVVVPIITMPVAFIVTGPAARLMRRIRPTAPPIIRAAVSVAIRARLAAISIEPAPVVVRQQSPRGTVDIRE